MEHQIVAVLHLGKEQPVLAAMLFAFAFGEVGRKVRQPLLTAGQQILRCERVRQFLEPLRVAAFQEGVGALLEVDLLLAHPVGQPVMLIQADTGSEGKVGAHSYEHPPPAGVVEIEIVLDDPTLRHLQMPLVVLLVAVGDQNPPRLTGPDNRHDLIRLGVDEIRVEEFVPAAFGRFYDRRAPLLGSVGHPMLVLLGDVAEFILGYPLPIAIRVEEPNHSLGLLEWLDQAVQQQPIEAPVMEPDAMLMMFEKSVHGRTSCVVRYQEYYAMNASPNQPPTLRPPGISRGASVRT